MADSSVANKVICLDPGHGGTADTDDYRVGPGGEREEWINLRVAKLLNDLLVERGARVVMTRHDDVHVDLSERAHMAREVRADAFLSIHHNATADRSVNFPIIYYHGMISQNKGSVRIAQLLGSAIRDELFGGEGPLSVVSDFTIFPTRGAAVLRGTYGVPAVIGEASFFSNAEEEARLTNEEYNRREARAYLHALEEFFAMDVPVIHEKNPEAFPPPFEAFEQAERMKPEALRWRENYNEARVLAKSKAEGDWRRALELASLSAKSFPDSPVARECHLLRAEMLQRLGENKRADEEWLRAREFYSLEVSESHQSDFCNLDKE